MRRRLFPLNDVLSYGGILLIFLAASVIALFTQQNWSAPAIFSLILVDIAAIIVLALFFTKKWNSRPDRILDNGTYVWFGNVAHKVADNTKEALQVFQDFFVGMAIRFDIEDMLKSANIEWRKGPITQIGRGWILKKVYGFQIGYTMAVQWFENISDSAFVHELAHMVDEIVLKRTPDWKHERQDTWKTVDEINSILREKGL